MIFDVTFYLMLLFTVLRVKQLLHLVGSHFFDVSTAIYFVHSCNICFLSITSLWIFFFSSFAPWAQCPLVSTTYFTKRLHLFLSDANPHRVQISLLHQSSRSSAHLLLGLLSCFSCPLCQRLLVLSACHLAFCICGRIS